MEFPEELDEFLVEWVENGVPFEEIAEQFVETAAELGDDPEDARALFTVPNLRKRYAMHQRKSPVEAVAQKRRVDADMPPLVALEPENTPPGAGSAKAAEPLPEPTPAQQEAVRDIFGELHQASGFTIFNDSLKTRIDAMYANVQSQLPSTAAPAAPDSDSEDEVPLAVEPLRQSTAPEDYDVDEKSRELFGTSSIEQIFPTPPEEANQVSSDLPSFDAILMASGVNPHDPLGAPAQVPEHMQPVFDTLKGQLDQGQFGHLPADFGRSGSAEEQERERELRAAASKQAKADDPMEQIRKDAALDGPSTLPSTEASSPEGSPSGEKNLEALDTDSEEEDFATSRQKLKQQSQALAGNKQPRPQPAPAAPAAPAAQPRPKFAPKPRVAETGDLRSRSARNEAKARQEEQFQAVEQLARAAQAEDEVEASKSDEEPVLVGSALSTISYEEVMEMDEERRAEAARYAEAKREELTKRTFGGSMLGAPSPALLAQREKMLKLDAAKQARSQPKLQEQQRLARRKQVEDDRQKKQAEIAAEQQRVQEAEQEAKRQADAAAERLAARSDLCQKLHAEGKVVSPEVSFTVPLASLPPFVPGGLVAVVLPWALRKPPPASLKALAALLPTCAAAELVVEAGALALVVLSRQGAPAGAKAEPVDKWTRRLQEPLGVEELCLGQQDAEPTREVVVACFKQVDWDLALLYDLCEEEGLVVAGLRLVYPTLANVHAAPSGHLRQALAPGEPSLVCAIRGPSAFRLWQQIAGSPDPTLARRTQPQSLNARLGGSGRNDGVVTAPASRAKLDADAAFAFGGRLEDASPSGRAALFRQPKGDYAFRLPPLGLAELAVALGAAVLRAGDVKAVEARDGGLVVTAAREGGASGVDAPALCRAWGALDRAAQLPAAEVQLCAPRAAPVKRVEPADVQGFLATCAGLGEPETVVASLPFLDADDVRGALGELAAFCAPQAPWPGVGATVEVICVRVVAGASVCKGFGVALPELVLLLVMRGEHGQKRMDQFLQTAHHPACRHMRLTPDAVHARAVCRSVLTPEGGVPLADPDALHSLWRFTAPSLRLPDLFPEQVEPEETVALVRLRGLGRLLSAAQTRGFGLGFLELGVPPAALADAVWDQDLRDGTVGAADEDDFRQAFNGPLCFVVLSRVHALKQLAQLAGPGDPRVSKQECLPTLRSLGRSCGDNGLRCATTAANALAWREQWRARPDGPAPQRAAFVRVSKPGKACASTARDCVDKLEQLVALRLEASADGWCLDAGFAGPGSRGAERLREHGPTVGDQPQGLAFVDPQ